MTDLRSAAQALLAAWPEGNLSQPMQALQAALDADKPPEATTETGWYLKALRHLGTSYFLVHATSKEEAERLPREHESRSVYCGFEKGFDDNTSAEIIAGPFPTEAEARDNLPELADKP